MTDPTEGVRRALVEKINAEAGSREALETEYGEIWDTDQLRASFEVLGFLAPFVIVRRRSDGVRGSLLFQHSPRLYHSFKPE